MMHRADYEKLIESGMALGKPTYFWVDLIEVLSEAYNNFNQEKFIKHIKRRDKNIGEELEQHFSDIRKASF